MGEALGGLGISWQGLVGQIINFVILLVLLYIIAYKPIKKILDERSRRIREGMEKAEFSEKRASEIDQEEKRRLEEARREGQAIIAQATEMGEQLKEEARQEVQEEVERLIAKARSEIQLEREQAIAELGKEFVDVAISAAEKVINESLDKERHRRLIDEALKESAALKK